MVPPVRPVGHEARRVPVLLELEPLAVGWSDTSVVIATAPGRQPRAACRLVGVDAPEDALVGLASPRSPSGPTASITRSRTVPTWPGAAPATRSMPSGVSTARMQRPSSGSGARTRSPRASSWRGRVGQAGRRGVDQGGEAAHPQRTGPPARTAWRAPCTRRGSRRRCAPAGRRAAGGAWPGPAAARATSPAPRRRATGCRRVSAARRGVDIGRRPAPSPSRSPWICS